MWLANKWKTRKQTRNTHAILDSYGINEDTVMGSGVIQGMMKDLRKKQARKGFCDVSSARYFLTEMFSSLHVSVPDSEVESILEGCRTEDDSGFSIDLFFSLLQHSLPSSKLFLIYVISFVTFKH